MYTDALDNKCFRINFYSSERCILIQLDTDTGTECIMHTITAKTLVYLNVGLHFVTLKCFMLTHTYRYYISTSIDIQLARLSAFTFMNYIEYK